jgi:hypothetical protein
VFVNAITIPPGLARFAIPEVQTPLWLAFGLCTISTIVCLCGRCTQAGLRFVSHHSSLFRAAIVSSARDVFNRILACLYSKHKRVSYVAADAAAAVLVQIAAGLTSPAPPSEAKSVFNSFMRTFVSMMEGNQPIEPSAVVIQSKLDSMRLGMKGCGIFAGAISAFMGVDQLKVTRSFLSCRIASTCFFF